MYGVHISVLRPNTMVVTATAEYHKATRKIFLTHFAHQLEYADGMKTINSMVQLCSKSMSLHTDEDSRRQAPLTHDLLRQPLILPLAAAFDRKQVVESWHNSGLYSLSLRPPFWFWGSRYVEQASLQGVEERFFSNNYQLDLACD